MNCYSCIRPHRLTACAALVLMLVSSVSHATTFHVTTLDDDPGVADSSTASAGTDPIPVATLREAITRANSSPGPDSIRFSITGNISILEALPALNDHSGGTVIDGAGVIAIDGNTLGKSTHGIRIESPDNLIIQMTIVGFSGNGIQITGTRAKNNIVRGCRIGTDGQQAIPNLHNGILIDGGASANRIGLPGPDGRNIISGNSRNGIDIRRLSNGNSVENNYIGLDESGAFSIPNGVLDLNASFVFGMGIFVEDSRNTVIGGSTAGSRNYVSGNFNDGVYMTGKVTGSSVLGNSIGFGRDDSRTIVNGSEPIELPQSTLYIGGWGVLLSGASGVNVGDSCTGCDNLISGNHINAIWVNGGARNSILGNRIIGENNPDVGFAPEHLRSGIQLTTGATENQIGSTEENAGNLIDAYWDLPGISLSSAGSNNKIQGNVLPSLDGIHDSSTQGAIEISATSDTQIGGREQGAGNVIHGRFGYGIRISSGQSSQNTIAGNSIYDNVQDAIYLDFLNVTAPVPVFHTLTAGSASACGSVDMYADLADEAEFYLGFAKTGACGNFTSDIDLTPYIGLNLTATATDSLGNTSELSAPIPITLEALGLEGEDAPPVNSRRVPKLSSWVAPGTGGTGLSMEDAETHEEMRVNPLPNLRVPHILVTDGGRPVSDAEPRPEPQSSTPVISGVGGPGLNAVDPRAGTEGEPNCFCTPLIHTADMDADSLISLNELLRTIQFYRFDEYHCEATTEDGFDIGPGAQDCQPHTADYLPQDWSVSLTELMRTIQFYNSGGYTFCPTEDTEDGYCPATA